VTPILLTATAAALAFLPFALAGDIPGNEIVHTIAWVVLGGLVTTTLINLFAMPALYLRFGASPESVRPAVPAPVPTATR
jgi:Cu/Ag efflux pump CusA